MSKIILFVAMIGLFFAYQNYKERKNNVYFKEDAYIKQNTKEVEIDDISHLNFTCDGREHCSQMTSCEEATYFINNCPNTKMDGNHDGVPCERQWCY